MQILVTCIVMAVFPPTDSDISISLKLEGVYKGHKGTVNALAFGRASNQLYSGADDNEILVWNLSKTRPVARLSCDSKVYSLSLSKDDALLLVGSNEDIQLWDVPRRSRRRVFKTTLNQGGRALFLDDRLRLLVASSGPSAYITDDIRHGSRVELKMPVAWNRAIRSTTVSPDSKVAAFGMRDDTVEVYNMSDGKLVTTMGEKKIPISVTGMNGVAFSPDGRVLCAVSQTGDVYFWETENWELAAKVKCSQSLATVAYSPTGQIIAIAGGRELYLLDVHSKTIIANVERATVEDGFIRSVAFTRDGRFLASAGTDCLVHVWKLIDEQKAE